MTSMPSPHAAAYRTYTAALRDALAFTDPDLSPDGLARQRAALIRVAREGLAAATPPSPEPTDAGRTAVYARRAPSTADDIAVQGREWVKVRELLNAGRTLPTIIAAADERRVAAILDAIETLPEVVTSGSGEEIAAELRQAAFSRLVTLGAADAVSQAEAERRAAVTAAWSRALTEAQAGDVSLSARTAVRQADEAGYREAFSGEAFTDHAAVSRTEWAADQGAA